MRHALKLIAFLLVATVARADDVTMKNGKVHKNLTLQRETKTAYIYLTHEGRKMTLPKSAVKSVDKKPTVRGELLEKIKKVGKRDADGLVALGSWADEQGMKKDAKDLFKKALRADRNHEAAHEALGDKKLNGKWVKEAVWRKAMAKEFAKEYKARGWKELKGEWMSPVEYARKKEGLVQVQGQWVDSKQAKKIDKKKLTWAEGHWLDAKEKAQFDAGMRKHGKSWRDISTLNDVHADLEDPWVIESEHFILQANCRYEDAKWTLKLAEEFYKPLVALFGEEHRTLHDKGRGKIVFIMGRGVKSYQTLGKRWARADRVAFKSSGCGTFYSLSANDGNGAAISFHESDHNLTELWIANAVTNAFVAQCVSDYLKTDEKVLEGLSGYIVGFDGKGKYLPTATHNHWWHKIPCQKPMGAANTVLGRIGYKSPHTLGQAGLIMHFLNTKNPKAFQEFWRGFIGGKGGDAQALIKACYGETMPDNATYDAEFAKFHKDYASNYRGVRRTRKDS